jgi:hypothetical protein
MIYVQSLEYVAWGVLNAVSKSCCVHVAYANDRNSAVTLPMHTTVFLTEHAEFISCHKRFTCKSLRNSV